MGIIILAALGGFVLIFVVFMILRDRSSREDEGSGDLQKKIKNRDAIVMDAARRLNSNPRDPWALKNMGDVYFQEGAWVDAMKSYETLADVARINAKVDEFEANLRYGLSALKLNMADEALKGLSAARGLRPNNFEVNYNLGGMEFEKKNYDKAIQFLRLACQQEPENVPALRLLGHALFRVKKAAEAAAFIRKAIDLAPDDKESAYTLGECYYEAGQSAEAMRIFTYLRADPLIGPSACLLSGVINMDQHNPDKAIQDFETGLKHQNIKPDILLDLRYRLANAYIAVNDIGKAMALLVLIRAASPGYKDVAMLIGKYQELNANRNLQLYLLAPSVDFIAICRKIVMGYYPRAKVRITGIEVHNNEWADLLAEVDTAKWSDIILFRFIRIQDSVGDLIVRDFHSYLKEVKAGKGICITVGSFGEEAKHYAEGRPIDLVEKDRLSAILNRMDIAVPVVPAVAVSRPA
jgi:tetratricopeptide (TPR) repeat protein